MRLTPLDIAHGSSISHLKRVRRTEKKTDDSLSNIDIILCNALTLSEAELQSILKDAQINLIPRIEKVSRWAAYTTRQLSEFRTLWPVTLRKDSTRCDQYFFHI
jgi:hypothetical protein